MNGKKFLVTGGTGFIGSALVRRLVRDGHQVRVLDNDSRGSAARLSDVSSDVDLVVGDIRDPSAVRAAVRGMDSICHLASVNGTAFFYTHPKLVLEVCVKGIINVLDACIEEQVGELLLASTSEVYQTPPVVPTDEGVALSIPDVMNPRYSYAGGKIISELLAVNYGRSGFNRVMIFRPHNVYGPDMGWEHVLPQFVLRMLELSKTESDPIPFPIQGSGTETRSFIYIDDCIDALNAVIQSGSHLNVYNIGTREERTIADVAEMVGNFFDRQIQIISGLPAEGGTPRRCPDIRKIEALGFRPRKTLAEGLPLMARWYVENANLAPGRLK